MHATPAPFIFSRITIHLLRLSSYKPGAMIDSTPFIFNLRLFAGDSELPYTYFSDAGTLRMESKEGTVEFVLPIRSSCASAARAV